MIRQTLYLILASIFQTSLYWKETSKKSLEIKELQKQSTPCSTIIVDILVLFYIFKRTRIYQSLINNSNNIASNWQSYSIEHIALMHWKHASNFPDLKVANCKNLSITHQRCLCCRIRNQLQSKLTVTPDTAFSYFSFIYWSFSNFSFCCHHPNTTLFQQSNRKEPINKKKEIEEI